MFCSRYLPLFGKPLSRIFVTMILRPFYGRFNHITKPLNMICLLTERILNNHLLSRILDILALKKSKTK